MRDDIKGEEVESQKVVARWLTVGVNVYLFTTKEKHEIKTISKILGWSPPHFVLLQMPYIQGVPLEVSKNMPCVVRYVSEGNIYGFKTSVMKIQFDPQPLLFLKYPENIENVSLRKSERIQAHIPVTFKVLEIPAAEGEERPAQAAGGANDGTGDGGGVDGADGPQAQGSYEGTILDMSQMGCRISVKDDLTNDAKILMTFILPPDNKIDNLIGYVKNIKGGVDSSYLGVQFDFQQNEEVKGIIQEFLDLSRTFRLGHS